MDVVRWYEEWDSTLTPDYNAMAVREATIEYNRSRRPEENGRNHPTLAHGSLGRPLLRDVSLNCIRGVRDLMHGFEGVINRFRQGPVRSLAVGTV